MQAIDKVAAVTHTKQPETSLNSCSRCSLSCCRLQVKGELDIVNSHVAAEDALKRRLTRELKLGSAVPPVLEYVSNVQKLEKLRLKEKNESKRIQVRSFARVECPPHRHPARPSRAAPCNMTIHNSIQHSSLRMQAC